MKLNLLIKTIILTSLFLILSSTKVSAFEYYPTIKIFSGQNLKLEKEIHPKIDEYYRQLSIETLDLGGDGQDEIILALGEGSEPWVYLFNTDGYLINKFLAYQKEFTGGVELNILDLDNDGIDEIITNAKSQGGSHIRIFDGFGKPKINPGFFAFDPKIISGVQVGVISSDQLAIIAYSPEIKKIKILNINGQETKNSIQLENNTTFLNISNVDLGGDNHDEILIASGRWGEPTIGVYRADGSKINEFLAYPKNFNGGINITSADLDNDGKDEIIAAAGILGGPHLRIFDGFGREKISHGTFVYNPEFRGGVDVAAGDMDGDGQIEVLTIEQNIPQIESAEKIIDIDISEQKLRYYQYGIQLGEHSVSSGMISMPTPLGEFEILNKQREAYSRAYNLYMPYWMAFTYSGAGLHGLPFWKYSWGISYEGVGHLGYRVSHGCVRLAVEVASHIYPWADVGTPVIVHQ